MRCICRIRSRADALRLIGADEVCRTGTPHLRIVTEGDTGKTVMGKGQGCVEGCAVIGGDHQLTGEAAAVVACVSTPGVHRNQSAPFILIDIIGTDVNGMGL